MLVPGASHELPESMCTDEAASLCIVDPLLTPEIGGLFLLKSRKSRLKPLDEEQIKTTKNEGW